MSVRTKRRASRRAVAKQNARWEAEIVSCLPPGLEWDTPYREALEIIRPLVEGTYFRPVKRRVTEQRQFEALAALGYRVVKVEDEPYTYKIDFDEQLRLLADYIVKERAPLIEAQVREMGEAVDRIAQRRLTEGGAAQEDTIVSVTEDTAALRLDG